MEAIKLEKKYPHISDEDFTAIFQEGYLKGFENGRKDTILIKWIKSYARHKASKGFTEIERYWQSWEDDVLKMIEDWKKEKIKKYYKFNGIGCSMAICNNEYIPKEWIKKWMRKSENTYNREQVNELISDWEKENAQI